MKNKNVYYSKSITSFSTGRIKLKRKLQYFYSDYFFCGENTYKTIKK